MTGSLKGSITQNEIISFLFRAQTQLLKTLAKGAVDIVSDIALSGISGTELLELLAFITENANNLYDRDS